MGIGIVNVPGAQALERKRAEQSLRARIGSVEKTLGGSEKIPGTAQPTAQVAAQVGQVYINVITGEEWRCVSADADGTVWEKQAASTVGLTAEQVGAVGKNEKGTANGVATLDAAGKVPAAQLPPLAPFVAGTSAPDDTTRLWIDTTAVTGGLKYYNGSAWVHVPVAYT